MEWVRPNVEWIHVRRDAKGNLVSQKMFGDFPSSWKQRPCPVCWNINQDINLECEYWGTCEHGYEEIVKKGTSRHVEYKIHPSGAVDTDTKKIYEVFSKHLGCVARIYSSDDMIEADAARSMLNANRYCYELTKQWQSPINEWMIVAE